MQAQPPQDRSQAAQCTRRTGSRAAGPGLSVRPTGHHCGAGARSWSAATVQAGNRNWLGPGGHPGVPSYVMVTTGSLLLFLTASIPLILFPGPSVAFILATTLRAGRRSRAGGDRGRRDRLPGARARCRRRAVRGHRRERRAVHRRQGARRRLAAVDGVAQPAQPGPRATLADLARPGRRRRHAPTASSRAACWSAPSTPRPPCSTWRSCRSSSAPTAARCGPSCWCSACCSSCWPSRSTPAGRWPVAACAAAPAVRLRVVDRFSAGVYTALAAVTLSVRRATPVG